MAKVSLPPAPPPPTTPSTPLSITIRFTTSIPDLLLDVPVPSQTTVISLKHLIRSKLPPPTSAHRLRLIHAGKLLPDSSSLPSVLKIPPPPPHAALTDPSGKGKGKAIDEAEPLTRVYINCSIGDVLSAEELAAEATAASASTKALLDHSESSTYDDTAEAQTQSISASTTTPAPRGFDRLLSAGFTPAEVGQLHLQFLSIQAATHTPDTMPSPTTLRRLEDAWIDDNGATASGGNEADADLAGGAIDDLLIGHIIGFLWPLGAMGWLLREHGIWSGRRQTAVWSGFMLCLAFGFMNVLA